MRNTLSFLGVGAVIAMLVSGCAGPEAKLGRGMVNVNEFARMGELRYSIEQTSVFDSPDAGCTYGVIHGFDRSLARTGLGIYDILTFPFPPYRPLFARSIPPEAVYPDNYKPGLMSGSMFDTHAYVGFSGGDVAPFVPGSRFKVFDNN